MKSINNGGDRALNGRLLSINEAPSIDNELKLIELVAKESHENPQTTQAIVKTI